MKKNITLINVISNIVLQFITILSGFIIPKIILSSFGSEVNGLISSLNQFLGYISLVEGSIDSIVMAALYKPIINNDTVKISSIVKTSKNFYNKLSIIFIVYNIVLALVYPIAFNTEFSFSYISSLAMILGLGLLIQYNFSLTLRTFLIADKKGYIVYWSRTFITILNILLFYIVNIIYPNIHIMKLISSLLFIIQPIIYNRIVKKHYKLDKNANEDKNIIKNRWDGFSISLAAFIHNNTDVIILTSFSDLKTVSVYSVYALVTKGLSSLLKAISNAIAPSIGQAYARNDEKELNEKFDFYEDIIFSVSFFMFVMGGLQITPFVMLYTKGITDANYYQPLFGVLIIIAELIFAIKEPYLQLAYSANKFKEIKKHAYIEAILNVTISLTLVNRLGLIGVATGTLIAMMYRTIYQVYYLKKNIIHRKMTIFTKKVLLYSIVSILVVVICNVVAPINIESLTLGKWVIHSILYSLIMILGLIFMNAVFYRNFFIKIKGYLKK